MHQIAPFKKKLSGGHAPKPPYKGAALRAIHSASGMYIPPQYYPPPCLNMDLRP